MGTREDNPPDSGDLNVTNLENFQNIFRLGLKVKNVRSKKEEEKEKEGGGGGDLNQRVEKRREWEGKERKEGLVT